MKTITIRLPSVEAAMLLEVQKVNKAFRDLEGLVLGQIRQDSKGQEKSLKEHF